MIWLMSEVSKPLTDSDSGVEAINEGMKVGHLGWFENKKTDVVLNLLCDKKPVKWSNMLILEICAMTTLMEIL